MAIKMVRCSVLGSKVVCVTGVDPETLRVMCPEREKSTGTCRLKRGRSRGGPLSQLLERLSEGASNARGVLCTLHRP